MKNKIGYVDLDSSTACWLMEHLPQGELRRGLEELLDCRIRSLMLEMEEEAEKRPLQGVSVIRRGALTIDAKLHKAERDGEDLMLTPKEFDILWFLARNQGEVFTKEQIYQAVWDGQYLMDDSNIMAFIRKIRKKIEPNPDAPQYIMTIWGIGYKFNENL